MNINRLGTRIAAMVVALLAAAIGTVSYFALARSADSLETASDMYGREAQWRARAVVAATYAASIESDLSAERVVLTGDVLAKLEQKRDYARDRADWE